MHLLLRVEAPAPVYLGVDNAPVVSAEVLTFVAAELGLPAPQLTVRESQRGGDKRVSNALLRGTGFEFSYPSYVEGYRALLAGAGTRHP